MSKNEVNLPGVNDAVGVLDAVYVDAFFSKLAEHGYQPRTDADAAAMLETGVQTDSIPNEPTEKSASDSPYAAINERLRSTLAEQGLVAPPSADEQIKSAAFMYAQNPDVYASVLAVKAAEAQAILDEQAAAE